MIKKYVTIQIKYILFCIMFALPFKDNLIPHIAESISLRYLVTFSMFQQYKHSNKWHRKEAWIAAKAL